MIPRPRVRIAIWVAALIVGGAYLIRSVVLRGGDFSLDAADVTALVVFVAGAALVGWSRIRDARETRSDEAAAERHDENAEPRDDR